MPYSTGSQPPDERRTLLDGRVWTDPAGRYRDSRYLYCDGCGCECNYYGHGCNCGWCSDCTCQVRCANCATEIAETCEQCGSCDTCCTCFNCPSCEETYR